MTKRKVLFGIIGAAALLLLIIATALPYLVVYDLTSPKPSTIPERKDLGGFPVEDVSLKTSDEIAITGWHVRVPGKKAVILLHGISANRLQHLAKAELYTKLGYSVLMCDARGHGANPPTVVTGGWYERFDLEAAMAYMREQGYEHIGLNGFSMGAATITFAHQDDVKPDFVVLESCYKDVHTLIRNAVQDAGFPASFADPVFFWMNRKMDITVEEMSPLNFMPKITAPTLILLGDTEFQVHEDQAQEMLEKCGAKTKKLFVFNNAGHDVFSASQPDVYREQLAGFLQEVEASWPVKQAINARNHIQR